MDSLGKEIRVATDGDRCATLLGAAQKTDIDLGGKRLRHPSAGRIEDRGTQVESHRLTDPRARLGARQREQLAGQAHRAVGGPLHLDHQRTQSLRIGLARRLVGMQFECGERCAQLVGGIGDEMALRGERIAQPEQQVVHGLGERRHLGRQGAVVDRLERMMGLGLERLRHLTDRRQCTTQ